MKIVVKSLTGKTIILKVDGNELVERVKQKIYDKEGILPDRMRLIYARQALEDGHTLAEYKVANNATLIILMSLGSGAVEAVEEKPKKPNGAWCTLQ